jgi:hypothetical protein
MTVIIPDDNPIRLADPHDAIQESAYQLFVMMCGQYEWCNDEWRTRMRKLLDAFIEYFDYHSDVFELVQMYHEALEDAKTCRGHVKLENWLRDDRLARQQAEAAVTK